MQRIILFCIILSINSACFARFATVSDAPVEVLQRDIQILIRKDGTCELDVKKKVKIINERGRESYSKVALTYNYDNSRIKVLTATSSFEGKEYVLPQNLIEDKPLASEIQGFDQSHQILLAFPNVNVGSTVYLHYKLEILKAEIPDFFEYMFDFSKYYFLESNIHIKSELPLYLQENDPDKYFSITKNNKDKEYSLDIKLLKPIYIDIVDEKSDAINPKKYPWVFVTTSDSWDMFSNKLAVDYLKVTDQKLPKIYEDIYINAKKLSEPLAQIELVAALLNEQIQYMGDWKTSEGRHIPQNLQNVTQNRLGDCKDFAAGMVAILKKLGFDANVALVQRGHGIYDTDIIKLPGSFHFNHAIVMVKLSQDRILWVDPTNFFSTATNILPDIADRQALVLDETSYLKHIPQSAPSDDMVIIKKTLDLKNEDLVKVQSTLTLKGLAAVYLTGAGLQVSQSTIDNAIVHELGNYDNIIDKNVKSPKLDSRIVRDLEFQVDYVERNMLLNTNAGHAILIKKPFAAKFIFNEEHAADIYLGAPKTIQDSVTIDNVQINSKDVLDYKLQSPWVDVTRTVKYKDNSVTIEQKAIIKVSWLYADVIKTPEYKNFAAELAKHFKHGIAIVFN